MLGAKARHTARQHLGLPQRNRQRECLQRHERLAERRAPVDPVPTGQEARQRVFADRLDLAPERRQRGAAQTPQHVGIAPLALGAAGSKLAAHEQIAGLELDEHVDDVPAESICGLRARERPTALCEAEDELSQRIRATLEEGVRQPRGRHRAERVAVAARVLRGDQPLLAGDPHDDGAALVEQRRGERRLVLAGTQVAADPQLVVELVGRLRVALQLTLHLLDRVGVEQVAQLLLAEQLTQQVTVERQRLRTPLGGRRVVLVHVRRDVVEEQRRASTATRSGSRPRRCRARASAPRAATHATRAGRRRPAGTRGTSRG